MKNLRIVFLCEGFLWGELMENYTFAGGEIQIRKEGLMTVLEAALPAQGDRPLRLAALCGKTMYPLGVLMPDGKKLRLRRRLSRAEWEAAGLHSLRGFTLLGSGDTVPQPEKQMAAEVEEEKKPPTHKRRDDWFAALEGENWQACPAPGRCFRDAALAKAAQQVQGALLAESGAQQLLAIPMDSGCPFPPLPVFRYGEPVVIRGQGYVLFRLQEGRLLD